MLDSKTEMFFPPSLIPELQKLRGGEWERLVERVSSLPVNHPERLAFILLMVRLGGCVSCHADSYWAMKGCARCSKNTILRFRGTDEELLGRFETAFNEIKEYLDRLPT
jgi:hypothetical protein